MRIQVDDRIGSVEMAGVLGKDATVARLQYGDACFQGNGPDGCPVMVGVERKRIKDLLQSMTSGRFAAQQLSGLINSYNVVYLVVEGVWRYHPQSGLLQEWARGGWEALALGGRQFMARDIDCFLNTMDIKCGVRIRRTGGLLETVQLIRSLYAWWNNKEWEEHRSHLALHVAPDFALLRTPSLVRRVAKELPGIGWERSMAAEKLFKTVAEMVNAPSFMWETVPGVGLKTAQRIRQALNTPEGERR